MCVGMAAVFNSYSEDLGYFREKISPGAFRDCLARDDVRALFNHDVNKLLGRNTSGTLRMVETNDGLSVEIDLPEATAGRDVAEYLGRRDVTGMSFSFDMDEGIEEWDYSGSVILRTLVKVGRLYDVGPVTFPAYTNTSAAMRSLERNRPKPTSIDNSLLQARARQLTF